MHRSPVRHVSAALRGALAQRGRRLAPDSGRLLLVAALLLVTGLVVAALPAQGAGRTTGLAVDAASRTVAIAPNEARRPDDRHDSDWRRGHGRHSTAPPTAAADPNANCSLIVPADPASAAGLTTPYRLTATDPHQGACHETNADQSAFVEAAIFDPIAHSVAIY